MSDYPQASMTGNAKAQTIGSRVTRVLDRCKEVRQLAAGIHGVVVPPQPQAAETRAKSSDSHLVYALDECDQILADTTSILGSVREALG